MRLLSSPLAWALTVLLAVVFGFQSWVLIVGHDRAIDMMSTRAANRAQATANQVESLFKQTDLILQDVRRGIDPEEIKGGPTARTAAKADRMRAFLRELRSSVPQVNHLHVVGADGRCVYSTADPLPADSFADRDHFHAQAGQDADRFLVSDPFVGRVTHRWGVFPSRRLIDARGRFAGIVVASIDAEALGSLMMAVDQQAWTLVLVGERSQLVARTPPRKSLLGTAFPEPGLNASRRSGTSRFEGAGFGESNPMLWAAQRLNEIPLIAVAGFSRQRALAQWQSDLRINLMMAGLVIAGCVVILTFHRRRRLAEMERAQLQVQLNQSQKMESVGRLAGGVAHDFNNMLSVILSTSEQMLQRVDPESQMRSGLELIIKATQRSASLTRQLLAFARQQPAAPRTLDLNDAIESMLNMLRRVIGEGIRIRWAPGADLWNVYLDPTQVDQVLANLLVNARDAMQGKGTLTIETHNVELGALDCASRTDAHPGPYVVLSVTDDGCGIDPAVQARVFEPFFTTKKPGDGTGLGLATVYGIVHQNRGFITLYSEMGRGTTFRLYFPREDSPVEGPRPEAAAEAPAIGHETILLVEDTVLLLESIQGQLADLGYQVLACPGGEEALETFAERGREIHLVLTDVIMPGMNGRELVERLRERQPGLRCLFMSGYPADVIAQQGILEEGVHFIQKPFTQAALASKLREVLAGG